MKILSKKSVKIIIYVILVYLISTWGVNHVMNPVVYVQNIMNRDKHVANVEITEDAILIYPEESIEEFPYISFKMDCSEQYMLRAEFFTDVGEEAVSCGTHTLENGVNSIKIENPDTVCVRFVTEKMGEYTPEITDVVQASYPKVNLWKSLEICIAFIVIILFWDGLQYIRTQYTVS